MIAAALAAADQIFTAPFRSVLWKTLGLTVLVLALFGALLEHLVVTYVHLSTAWLATGIHVLAGLGLSVGAFFLVPTVSFAVASLFFDELAQYIEETIAGPAGVGRALPVLSSFWIGLKFSLVSLVVFALAIALLLVPGVNIVAFFAANAYLFGRGFFELAALRYVDIEAARELRARHTGRIFIAGCVIAALASVPILNLLTPLFAAAFMVRVTQPLVRPRLSRAAV